MLTWYGSAEVPAPVRPVPRSTLADRAHLRLTHVDPLRGRQSGGIDRRIAARIGKLRQVVEQNGRVIAHTHRRRVSHDLRDIPDHQGVVSRYAVRRVDDVAELPTQGAGGAGDRLYPQGVTEVRATDDGKALQRHAHGQRILDHDVPGRVFLHVQRQIVGDGVADAQNRMRCWWKDLGIGIRVNRFDDGGVVNRVDGDRLAGPVQ